MQTNKKLIFDDNGDVISNVAPKKKKTYKEDQHENGNHLTYHGEKTKFSYPQDIYETNKKWYQVFPEFSCDEVFQMENSAQMELYNICRSAYDNEKPNFLKRNPSDFRWLLTALHKGTAKDRANAGALLITSNPLGNLEALTTLISLTRMSNKCSTEVLAVLTDLWREVLLPPQRKLYFLHMRAFDWRNLQNDHSQKELQRLIYAYWFFENELKDKYDEFLKNIQQGLQIGQEHYKTSAIKTVSQLLVFSPEKEQMILAMLINKLGDPISKVAAKALHHLTHVAYRHPNMCSVIVVETEKLLFRNNISNRSQRFGICYLSNIAMVCHPDVCTKLVRICFSLFKVLVQKGALNNRTMQAILCCLQRAIASIKLNNEKDDKNGLLDEDMQNTVYRLVHLADIRISIQTLGLLLQIISINTEKSDRFYNAFYIKLLDLNIIEVGSKIAANIFHVFHRAIHMDSNIQRAMAFIKRLLQLSLYMPTHMSTGSLIVINKLLRARRELCDNPIRSTFKHDLQNIQMHEAKLFSKKSEETSAMTANKYDPFYRVPAFTGADFVSRYELLFMRKHFHPTIHVFVDSIINNKDIIYYGDPLRDFSLSHFLERFSFKNPKKIAKHKAEIPLLSHRNYVACGTRRLSVKSLSKSNCPEDEFFIFNFFEQKRLKMASDSIAKESDELAIYDVNDDEFEEYLNEFFGSKTGKTAKTNMEASSGNDDGFDFLKELGVESCIKSKNTKKKKSGRSSDLSDDIHIDWNEFDDSRISDDNNFDGSFSDGELVNSDIDNESYDHDISIENDTESILPDINNEYYNKEAYAKRSNVIREEDFTKYLKQNDVSKLFSDVEDFAELLDEAGKAKDQGTVNTIFNQDASSDKQLKWEEKRRLHINKKQKQKVVKSIKKKKV